MAMESYILIELNGVGEKRNYRKIIFKSISVWASILLEH